MFSSQEALGFQAEVEKNGRMCPLGLTVGPLTKSRMVRFCAKFQSESGPGRCGRIDFAIFLDSRGGPILHNSHTSGLKRSKVL